jgi:hypothetical protein
MQFILPIRNIMNWHILFEVCDEIICARLFISILYWSEEAFRIMVIHACHTHYTMEPKRFVHVGISRFISVVTHINTNPLRPSLSNTLHCLRIQWNYQESKMTWERSSQIHDVGLWIFTVPTSHPCCCGIYPTKQILKYFIYIPIYTFPSQTSKMKCVNRD